MKNQEIKINENALPGVSANVETINRQKNTENYFQYLFVRIFLGLMLGLFPILVNAQTTFTVDAGTGGDDLRGGNTAFLSFVLTSGRTTSEQILSRGFAGNSNTTGIRVTFPETINETQIRSIRIRHDGNPRSGHPFDTYDNWNLKSLRVLLGGTQIYTSTRDTDFLGAQIRFTGALRVADFAIRSLRDEADFTITRIAPGLRGLSVTVSNIGGATGTIVNLRCSTFSRFITTSVGRSLAAGSETFVSISFARPAGIVTCSIQGTNSDGMPETVTANNVLSSVPR
ncbi:MAG: hypothetical protein LUM44_03485 [Pyrinomonadaceae bacterium]|nr:hypothetical protein [Pyrinomonadaceae bacterium]